MAGGKCPKFIMADFSQIIAILTNFSYISSNVFVVFKDESILLTILLGLNELSSNLPEWLLLGKRGGLVQSTGWWPMLSKNLKNHLKNLKNLKRTPKMPENAKMFSKHVLHSLETLRNHLWTNLMLFVFQKHSIEKLCLKFHGLIFSFLQGTTPKTLKRGSKTDKNNSLEV